MHSSVFKIFQLLSKRLCPDMKIQQNKEAVDVQQKGMGYFNVCRENYCSVRQLSSEAIKTIIIPGQVH